MGEPTTFTIRLRLAALKLVGGLIGAVSARTWLPGACHGATAGSLIGEHRAKDD